jgi:hypothetical protein
MAVHRCISASQTSASNVLRIRKMIGSKIVKYLRVAPATKFKF